MKTFAPMDHATDREPTSGSRHGARRASSASGRSSSPRLHTAIGMDRAFDSQPQLYLGF